MERMVDSVSEVQTLICFLPQSETCTHGWLVGCRGVGRLVGGWVGWWVCGLVGR